MVVLNPMADPPIVDVVLLIEDTALGSLNLPEIKTNYIVPTLEHFNGGPASDLDFASLSCSSSFSVVPFHASDCLPLPPSKIIGPFTSIKKVLTVLDKLKFRGGKGETLSSGQEGLANALQLFKEVEQKRGEDVATARHIVYVSNSGIYDMPVMDNRFYQGRKLEDLTTEIQDKGIFLSVIAPRRLSALFKLFEKAGGDLVGAKEKNYAKDPRHLVLLNGYTLQERPITPKPLPPASVSPSIPSSLHDQVNPGNVVPGPGPIQGQAPVPYSTQAPGQPRAPGQPPDFRGGVQPINPQQPGLLRDILKKPPVSSNQPGIGNIIGSNIINPQRPPVSVNVGMNPGPPQVSMGQQIPQQPNMATGMVRPGMNPQQAPPRERDIIWRGELEWQEKVKESDQKITHKVQCSVSSQRDQAGLPEVRSDNWPGKLIMQLIPKTLVQTIGGSYFRNSKSVLFHPLECESLVALTNVMGTGFAGCVHFTGNCDIKVLILLYSNDKKAYLGFIPNDQVSFVERIRTVIQQQKLQGQHMTPGQQQQQSQQQGPPGPPGPPGPGQTNMRMPNMGGGNMMSGPMTSQPQTGGMMGPGNVMMTNQGGGGMMMNQGSRMMMSVGGPQNQMIIQQGMGGQNVMAGGQQTQYVTMSAGQPGMQQQRIMQQQGQQQPMTPGLRQILQQQQQQQPGMMNMMQQGGMQANNQGMMLQQRMQGGMMNNQQQQQQQQQQQNEPMLRDLLN